MCECKIVPTCSRSEPHRIEYCALHRAAPELYWTTVALVKAIERRSSCFIEIQNAKTAMDRAKGLV